ncbi:MAG: autotransporter domain-containing protein [Candidatus Omnitrophota bacterium]
MKKSLSMIIIFAMVSSLSSPAFALPATWDGNGANARWDNDDNWSAAHPVGGENATFNATAGVTHTTVDLTGGAGCGTLIFDNATAAAYTIGSAAGQTITIANGGGILMENDVANIQTVNANVTLDPTGPNATFSNYAPLAVNILNIAGDVAGNDIAGILTLQGSNIGDNIIGGDISDGAAALGLTKDGGGKWILSGDNTYVGVTTVTNGTLAAGVASVADVSGAFGNNSAVTMANNAGAAIDITGFDTQIGSLTGGGAAGGNVTLGAATLTVGGDDTSPAAYAGIIDGTGGLTTTGAGTLTLGGVNTYTGATTIETGSTLALNAAGMIANSSGVANAGTLTIGGNKTIDSMTGAGATTLGANTLTIGDASNTSCTYSGIAGGAGGGITKAGTGTLTFTGAHHTYTGATTINAGTLAITGATTIGGDITQAAGTLDLGSNTLTLDGAGALGNYTQAGASTIRTTILNTTTAGKIDASASGTGTMTTLAASTLNITVGSGYIPNNTAWTILDGKAASGGVIAPTTVTSNSSVLTFTASAASGADDLIITASRAANGYPERATDSNASAAGSALEAAGNAGATGDMQTVLGTLDSLSGSQIASSLDTVVPEVDAGILNTSMTVMNNFIGVSMERVENVLEVAKAVDFAATGISTGEAAKLTGIWGKGYGSYMTQGTRNGIRGYDAWNAGTALGADHLFADSITLGASGGYAYGYVESDVNNANTCINSAQATLYGGYEAPNLPLFIDAAGSFAYNWYDGERDINIGDVILRTANSDYDGQQYGAYVGGGYRFDMTKNIEFTPLLSIQYNHLHIQSYTETEAGALSLSIASQDYDQLQSGLGARVAAPIKCKWGTVTPEVHGKWFYDFIGDGMVVTSNFTGGGPSFDSNGAKPALNSFNAGGELAVHLNNDISIVANCDTEIKDEFFGIYGSATLRYNF